MAKDYYSEEIATLEKPSVSKDYFSEEIQSNKIEPIKETIGQMIGRNAKEAVKSTYAETIAPLVHGSSTLAFGIPKAVAKETGTEKLIYPEQKSAVGKTLRLAFEAKGLFSGGAFKIADVVSGKVITKMVAPKLVKTMTKGAITGGVAGILQTPDEGEGILKPTERLKQGTIWGGLGIALPIAGAIITKTGDVITKTGRWVAKNVGGITDATVVTIKRLGANRVFDPLKAKADYIMQDLVPRVKTKLNQEINEFTPRIQKFAQEKLGIPESAINTIKKNGINTIDQVSQAYKNSTDEIYQRIANGFSGMRELTNTLYKDAVNSFKSNTINSQSFYQSIQSGLRNKGWIDLQGNPTTRYKGGLDPVADKLTDLYLDMRSITTNKGVKITGKVLSKEDFFTYRDALSNMLKEKPSDRLVMQARNALYDSAEKSGMTGLKEARDLEKRVFSMEDKFLDSMGNLKALGKENSLDKFHKLTKEQIRQLQDIENYIGTEFIDELDKITAGQYLNELNKIDPKKIATDLIRAKDPNWTKYIKEEYEKLLGENNFKDIYDDLMAHFSNMDFNLVSETPGAGGGMYPSRAGIIRSGVGKAAKIYYKDIQPKMGNIGEKLIEKGKEIINK